MLMVPSLFSRALRRRRALTLLEMLVAMTCTILLMFAITQTFQSIGEVSAKGRAAIEMSTQLRGVQHRLHKDFESLTVPVRPWPEAGAGEGYFEIIEGGNSRDNSFVGTSNDLIGDVDDIWAMTIRSTGEPFVGRYGGAIVQSHLAEVIWFTSYIEKDAPPNGYTVGEPLSLHRRVLLIRPDLNNNGQLPGYTSANYVDFLQANDISVRQSGGALIANSLADLTVRGSRFAHNPTFPNRIATGAGGFLDASFILSGDRTGEDVMLSNLLAADIRVFDPDAPIRSDGTDPLIPGDPGFRTASTNIGYGAYVDLGYNEGSGFFNGTELGRYANFTSFDDSNSNGVLDSGETRAPIFSVRPNLRSQLNSLLVYDTWSYWYEHDGIDQDGQLGVDQAENGLDDNNTNGVDDVLERETSPPYPVPLRGVQIRVRVLEPETSQVRQATVIQDFIPE